MKRFISMTLIAAVASAAMGQAPFTIYRPKDDEKVKETVSIQIPKNSMPANSFIGVYLNDKFIEATVPPVSGNFYVYKLDTKGRKIADGKYELRVVLYQDLGERQVMAGESKRTIHVANSSSIPVPGNGFALRYKFNRGAQYIYNFEQRINVSTITEAQAKMGGRASLQELDAEKFRYLYAVDNAYGNGDGLIRMQVIPPKGRDNVAVTIIGSEDPSVYYDYQMHPLYMRVNSTGMEQFGTIPLYVPLEGTGGESYREDLYGSFPLPTLPTKRVKPGDSWQTRFQLGSIDLDNWFNAASVVSKVPARGEFVGVEWQDGRQCAKLKLSISQGSVVPPGMTLTKEGMGSDKVSLEQTIWFDIYRGHVMKSAFDITIDQRTTDAPASGGLPGGNPGRGGAGPTGEGSPTRPGAASPDFSNRDFSQRGGRGGPPGEGGSPMGPGGGQNRPGQGMSGGGRQGGPAMGAIRLVRTRIQFTMSLEK